MEAGLEAVHVLPAKRHGHLHRAASRSHQHHYLRRAEHRHDLRSAWLPPPEVHLVRHEPVRRPLPGQPVPRDAPDGLRPPVGVAQRVLLHVLADRTPHSRGRACECGAVVVAAEVACLGPRVAKLDAVAEEAGVQRRAQAPTAVRGEQEVHVFIVSSPVVRVLGAGEGCPEQGRDGDERGWRLRRLVLVALLQDAALERLDLGGGEQVGPPALPRPVRLCERVHRGQIRRREPGKLACSRLCFGVPQDARPVEHRRWHEPCQRQRAIS
uniref:Uncharacterized protein n=1 Tax=Triticum urartu TaxID=4572 RepID=A0A8R7VKF6_TRIUA